MLASQLHRAKRLGKKLAHVAPLVASNPRLLPLMREGVHPEHYARLNVKWLRDVNIKTMLDIGANTGQFTGAIHALFPDAAVYAFEPQADCYQALERRFADMPKVHPVNTALGDEDGEITFHRNAFSQSSSVLELTDLHREAFPWADEREDIKVPLGRLDRIAADIELNPTVLVKIDVQGYEDRVLRGGEKTIRAADVVLIETSFEPLYEGEATFGTVYDLMVGYGFRYAGNLDQIVNPANDRPLYADALFIRDEA